MDDDLTIEPAGAVAVKGKRQSVPVFRYAGAGQDGGNRRTARCGTT